MRLYAYGDKNFDAEIKEGDQEIRVSPRGFANETYRALILPGCAEVAKGIVSEIDNDINAWAEVLTFTKKTAAQRNWSDSQSPTDIRHNRLVTPDGMYDPELNGFANIDDLRRWFGAATVDAALTKAS